MNHFKLKGVRFHWADEIKHWSLTRDTTQGEKLARAEGLGGFKRRCKAAWMVFTGKADVLMWKG